MNAFDLISAHEGLRLIPYRDRKGELTVGFGQHLDSLTADQKARLCAKHGDMQAVMVRGITLEEAKQLLEEGVATLTAWAYSTFPWFAKLTTTRQAVMLDMAYELGEGRPGKSGLLGFPRFLFRASAGDVQGAVNEMNNSHWAEQVPAREENDAKLWAEG